jgi:hypothetical protein
MTGATFKSAFVDFETDYEIANRELESAIADASRCLEFPSRRQTVARERVEDLHDAARTVLGDGIKDHRWLMARAWRSLKRAIADETAP